MTHVFKHPKYWAELRAEKRKLQAASLKQAIQEGDQNTALELAEKASHLNPKTDTVTATLFDLQIKNNDWEKAEETVKKLIKLNAIPIYLFSGV